LRGAHKWGLVEHRFIDIHLYVIFNLGGSCCRQPPNQVSRLNASSCIADSCSCGSAAATHCGSYRLPVWSASSHFISPHCHLCSEMTDINGRITLHCDMVSIGLNATQAPRMVFGFSTDGSINVSSFDQESGQTETFVFSKEEPCTIWETLDMVTGSCIRYDIASASVIWCPILPNRICEGSSQTADINSLHLYSEPGAVMGGYIYCVNGILHTCILRPGSASNDLLVYGASPFMPPVPILYLAIVAAVISFGGFLMATVFYIRRGLLPTSATKLFLALLIIQTIVYGLIILIPTDFGFMPLFCTCIGILQHILWIVVFSLHFLHPLHNLWFFRPKVFLENRYNRGHMLVLPLSVSISLVIVILVYFTSNISLFEFYASEQCFAHHALLMPSLLIPGVVLVLLGLFINIAILIRPRQTCAQFENHLSSHHMAFVSIIQGISTVLFWVFVYLSTINSGQIVMILWSVLSVLLIAQGIFVLVAILMEKIPEIHSSR